MSMTDNVKNSEADEPGRAKAGAREATSFR
jgi:hypothetical protein